MNYISKNDYLSSNEVFLIHLHLTTLCFVFKCKQNKCNYSCVYKCTIIKVHFYSVNNEMKLKYLRLMIAKFIKYEHNHFMGRR